MQLYALLESIEQRVCGCGKITVIYHTSRSAYDDGYNIARNDFPCAAFVKQGTKPAKDFMPLTLKTIFGSSAAYIMFAVDDDIVVDEINLQQISELLDENQDVYGFYLKMGLNLNYCYTLDQPQPLPVLEKLLQNDDVYRWRFKGSTYDWDYPLTLDMTVYRKSDVYNAFQTLGWLTGNNAPRNPNSLEGSWHERWSSHVNHLYGLCFGISKIINVPANLVQDGINRHENSFSPAELLNTFLAGYKINIRPLYKYCSHDAHEPIKYEFIIR